ncbi:MAG: hypothetical protein JJU34_18810 [Lunatimonas sp.]|uniref:hypothetical protein n=1 Tax=Lunatimonas sp. TaxID=2060141 RepID=UPI00263B145B|nr:hypothetical protein [Lunatimonas sp.]MCC5939338.1 hypothetical protein [Lunatimonas sp.]
MIPFSKDLKRGLLASSIILSVHGALAQEVRDNAFSVGPLVTAGLKIAQDERSEYLTSFSQVGAFVGYSHVLSTFFDVKVTGSLLSGRFHEPFVLVNSEGRQIGEVNRQRALHLEVLPVWYSNPNRVGYLPCRYLFYLGAGSGFALGRLSVANSPELTPNEQALLAYGFLDRGNTAHMPSNRVFVPVLIGVRQNRNGKGALGMEIKLNYFIQDKLPAGSQNLRIPAWLESKIYVAF